MTIPISCDNIINASNRRPVSNGEMSERFKELVLKTSDPKGPWVRIPLSPPFSYDGPINSDLEKYPSGRRGSPAKGVGRVERREGSNPSFSAKRKALIFNGSRLFSFCGLRTVTVAPFLKIFDFSFTLLYNIKDFYMYD